MKLYTYEPAPNAQRLALFLKYKGVELEKEEVDLMSGQQLSPEYRAINPDCTVPALVLDDGTLLNQVIGQCMYLDAVYPNKPLLGSTPLEKAEIMNWCHRLFNTLFIAVATVLRNRSKAFENRALPGPLDVPQIPELVERGRTQIHYILPELDAHLAENTWVTGDSFSMADIDLYVAINFLGWIKEEVPDECANLKAWYERATAELG